MSERNSIVSEPNVGTVKPGSGLSVPAVILASVAVIIAIAVPIFWPCDCCDCPPGEQGPPGLNGTNGINCWDLDQDGIADPDEDINNDDVVDVLDCAGPPGPQGEPGPPGPGTIMSHSSANTVTTFSGCTHFAGAEITIDADSAGTIVVTSMVGLTIEHTAGTQDYWRLVHKETDIDCGSVSDPYATSDEVPTDNPSENVIYSANFVQTVFSVSTAGSYTYYLNGVMVTGESSGDNHRLSNTVAVFYPS